MAHDHHQTRVPGCQAERHRDVQPQQHRTRDGAEKDDDDRREPPVPHAGEPATRRVFGADRDGDRQREQYRRADGEQRRDAGVSAG
ncbi:hypothetical protein A5784_00485 [Mycobacterium sp. 852013-50091_SCH5140682]|nr:hypothetical protein A5784_00485 [Mycobacterium sp. 852013-50091_SCH5140682]